MEIIGAYRAPERAGWASFNPSIYVDGEHRALILRQANYRMVNRRYVTAGGDEVIRTVNYLVELDQSFRQTDAFLIEHSCELRATGLATRYDFPVQGYEDCRLFRWRDHWWASATVRDTTPNGVCEMVLLRLDEQARIKQEYVLRGAFSIHHQKNWMPFVENDQLYFIYSLDPVRVMRFDRDRGAAEVFRENAAPGALEHLRGGGQLVRIDEGYLGICHQACGLAQSLGAYLHRFFTLDDDFRLSALSDVFSFTGAEVEFCAGLALGPDGNHALLSFGVDDREALLASIPLNNIRRVLRHLD
jgi:hypothetical protein